MRTDTVCEDDISCKLHLTAQIYHLTKNNLSQPGEKAKEATVAYNPQGSAST